MKNTRLYLFTAFLIIAVILCQQIISLSQIQQTQKIDLAELNNIKHGLFSINAWKDQIATIINDEIGKIDLKSSRKNLKPVIEAQLNELIDNVDRRLKDKNSKTFKGKFKQAFINSFVDIKEIKEGIPQYADTLIEVMERPQNKRKLRTAIQDKVDEYFDKTYDEVQETGQAKAEHIIQKTSSEDMAAARAKLEEKISKDQKYLEMLSHILILICVVVFVAAGFTKSVLPSAQYIILVGLLFILVITGVTTPMIDLEAKIAEMSFMLFDHQILFSNQVLYFQSKSIVDVFWVMIRHSDIKMNVVGVLIITFSIIFPITKLICSVAYYYNPRNTRENKWVQFFVLKSGKWSMTDVMIIAIFMAYIGFNGIVESQFGELHKATDDIILLTTNGTTLQFGFYVFMTYTVLAMFLSEYLTKQQAYEAATKKQFLRESDSGLRL